MLSFNIDLHCYRTNFLLSLRSTGTLHLETRIQELNLLTQGVQNSLDSASESARNSQQDILTQLLAHLRVLQEAQNRTNTTLGDLDNGVSGLRGLASQSLTGQLHSQSATQYRGLANITAAPSPSHSLQTIGIKVQQATIFPCPQSCFCQCHTHGQWESHRLLKDVIGVVFLGYSRTPTTAPSCNRTSCRRNQQSLITVIYVFPSWFLQRVLLIVLRLTQRDGPFVSLRAVRRRNGADFVFFCAAEGDLEKLRALFRDNEASPFDVSGDEDNSLLSVCNQSAHVESKLRENLACCK